MSTNLRERPVAPTRIRADAAAAVSVLDLSKTYAGGVRALDGVTFEVEPGEAFGLLGPNGAGKSTAIGVLTTTVRPTSGRARVGGFDVVREARAARGASGIVFQESVLDAPLTGRRNLELHARLWRLPNAVASRRIAEAVEAFGLGGVVDRPVRTMSGGQRRRLEIARAVLGEPRVLFLDEPTVGLDPAIRHELWSLVRDVRERRELTVLLTTHYLDEAERLCDRIAVLHEGRVVALDAPSALLSALGDEVLEVRADGTSGAVLDELRRDGIPVEGALQLGSLVTVPLRGGAGEQAARTLRASSIAVSSVALRAPTLDDVYLRLTGASLGA